MNDVKRVLIHPKNDLIRIRFILCEPFDIKPIIKRTNKIANHCQAAAAAKKETNLKNDFRKNVNLFCCFVYLHHEMKFDTLSRAKKVPLLAAGKKCILPIARIGPASPDVIDFVIDLLRA